MPRTRSRGLAPESDGTGAGTARVADLPASLSLGDQRFIGTDLNGLLIFAGPGAGLDAGGQAPWRSDGTASGTFPLANISLAQHLRLGVSFAPAGGLTFFTGSAPGYGPEPWATDGTVAGTSQVADLHPGPAAQARGSGRPSAR